MQIHSFIDNTFHKSESKFHKLNPYTLQPLHEVSSCDLIGLVTAIRSSHTAYQEWKSSSVADRLTLIKRIRAGLLLKRDEYARLEALDQGLPLEFVRKNTIELSLMNFDEVLKQKPQDENLQYSAVGVIALVASWNLSLRVILDRLIPALLAGNAVVVKVSSQSVVTAHILAEILLQAGAPKSLVNIIVTDDPEVKRTLVSHPGVRAVSFTGSIEKTSELLPVISQASLQNFKKIQISSGSKNSAVVMTEPLSENFSEIMNSFICGQGQLVWNSARLFILEKFEKEWEAKIKDYLQRLKPSEDIEDSSPWTPCIKPESFSKFNEIKRQIFEDKGQLLLADHNLSDLQKKTFLPAIFTKDMSRCSTLQQDQVHAPVFILSAVKYPFDVAKYSNVSYFGFAAHLWGEPEKMQKLAENLDVGLASVNKTSVEVPGAVTAVKQSGFGLQDFQSFGAFFSNVKKLK